MGLERFKGLFVWRVVYFRVFFNSPVCGAFGFFLWSWVHFFFAFLGLSRSVTFLCVWRGARPAVFFLFTNAITVIV